MDYIVTPDRLRNSLTGTDLRQACSSRHPLGENIRVSQFLGKLLVDFVPSQNALVSNLAVSRVILWKCVCHSSSPVRWLQVAFSRCKLQLSPGDLEPSEDSLIRWLQHWTSMICNLISFSHIFFFKSEAMNPFMIIFLFLVLWLINIALQKKAYTRRASDKAQVVVVVQ